MRARKRHIRALLGGVSMCDFRAWLTSHSCEVVHPFQTEAMRARTPTGWLIVWKNGRDAPSSCNDIAESALVAFRNGERWKLATKRPSSISKATRNFVYGRDRFRCLYCGSGDREKLTLDHVLPVCAGGPSTPDNLVTCCDECNTRLGDKPPAAKIVYAATPIPW